ncbi:MAG: TlpA family protein disulfide reductase [Gemmataceae bacterium]|nr:TlpA family protein disulfide reductase [Gemmataceae bacterium]
MLNKLMLPVLAIISIAFVSARAQDAPIKAVPVTYDGLKQEVFKHRGKVVILTFWSTKCPPCIKAFPDFIKKHEKYGDKGLVVISVSLDDTTEEEDVARANNLLTKWKSPLRNLIYADNQDHLKKLDYVGLPFYYIFDRHGKWVRYRGWDYRESKEGLPYHEIESVAVRMLNEK